MKAWFSRHRRGAAGVVFLALLLSAAYYFGGGAPGLRGWSASAPQAASSVQSETGDSSAQAASSSAASSSAASSSAVPAASSSASSQPAEKADESGPAASAKKTAAARPGGTRGGMTASEKTAAAKEIAGGNGSSAGVEQGDAAYSEKQGMKLDASTGKDQYQTAPVPEGKPVPVEPQDAVITDRECTCTFSISCAAINDNLSWLDPDKKELVPADGWLLKPTQVTFYEGESVFNVLLRTCKQQGIHMEYKNTPIYNSAYIEGIGNLYEFDCGELSGWMYEVNDWFPNYGCSRYQLQDGDSVSFVYTCDLGVDVGGYSAAAGG